ncbi:MAG: sterol desaturase family protein [Bacteroidota bacterium]
MEAVLNFFASLTTLQKMIWVAFCLAFFFALEQIIPLAKHKYNRLRHDGVNLVFLLMLMVINIGFGIVLVSIMGWTEAEGFGLLNWIKLPTWLGLVISLIALDLVSQYFAHYLLHHVKWMWRLHMVHHTDTKVDLTTGVRQHPIEFILRESLALVTFVLFGMPVSFYLLYRLITIFFTYWTHANIRLPKTLDRILSYVIITPDTHKFHHHFERPWTDTNFGNVLSIWDRAFGTFTYGSTDKISYGLDVADDSRDEDLKYQLGIPFNHSIKTDD